MPQQSLAAVPVSLGSISPGLISRKLRVAGRLLSRSSDEALFLLSDGNNALFVDISLCLNPDKSMPYLRENNATLVVLGYLEETQIAMPLPTLPLHTRTTHVDPYLVLRAILMIESPDLDLQLWAYSTNEQGRFLRRTYGD
ncbi:hypothetical protein WOLCODRAFT_122884 [Wolfiporia cocos MD-104 SS10]|uniref:Uncharacterized protein n=1 Tax=Wolfiporia cocos (strain MD-104) TaxID=742152 RepID=A0A2H3K4G4_WOLCO|nr:hypothetical protein WOLCODRAFT_122884 [Wolfiporia cocos MD-104 SS10]